MRVVLLPSAYAPSIGGVEEATRRLAGQLRRSGHEIEVWTTRHAGSAPAEVETLDGIVVRRFVMAVPPARLGAIAAFPRTGTATWRALREAAQRFRPEVLHVVCFSVNGAYATALSGVTGTPLVVTLQGETFMDDQDVYDHSTTLRVALRLGLRRAAAVTACSAYTLDDAVRRFGLAPSKGTVVFNGVDLEEDAPEAVDLPFDRYVLALGRVVRNKGFDLLIRAFVEVADDHPDVGLVVAGQGPMLPVLMRQARSFGMADRIHFPGPMGRGQVAWLMGHGDVFVMPSRVEPFGIVILEGWRAGCPVVASSIGGAPEFIREGADAMLVDPHDRRALAAVLDRVLGDAALRGELGAAGRARVAEFGWNRIAAQYEAVYRSVADHQAGVLTG